MDPKPIPSEKVPQSLYIPGLSQTLIPRVGPGRGDTCSFPHSPPQNGSRGSPRPPHVAMGRSVPEMRRRLETWILALTLKSHLAPNSSIPTSQDTILLTGHINLVLTLQLAP